MAEKVKDEEGAIEFFLFKKKHGRNCEKNLDAILDAFYLW
jgi:hypothetical protein